MQRHTALEDRLGKSFLLEKPSFHYFKAFEDLLDCNRRYHLDLIVVATEGDFIEEMKLIKAVKGHPTLQIKPIIFYSSKPDKDIVIEAYENGIDDFLYGYWDADVIAAKLRMLCYRSLRDIGANPSSGLPGAAAIEADVDRRVKTSEDFAVCYVDLDNFKAYNDYYGYIYGDKVIRMTATIIRDTVLDLVQDGFIGHIGGDDFVFNVPSLKSVLVSESIIDTFDKMIVAKYNDSDIKRGFIEVANRAGYAERFPIMTISIAIFPNRKVRFTHLGEISHMMADLKKYTKSYPGSNYRVERRAKY